MKENFYVKSMNLYYNHFFKVMYLKFKMLKKAVKEKKVAYTHLFMQCFKVCINIKKQMIKDFINNFRFAFKKINFNYLKCL